MYESKELQALTAMYVRGCPAEIKSVGPTSVLASRTVHSRLRGEVGTCLVRPESYLKRIDVIDSNVHRLTGMFLQKATADMQAWGPPFGEEEFERKRIEFHGLLR